MAEQAEFYVHLAPKSMGDVLRLGALIEDLQYDGLFFADSHLGNLDPFQVVAVAAQSLQRLHFGTAVTNMVYRDPTVLASSTMTAHELSDGRFTLGLGTGDGTVYRMGLKPTRMAAFEEGTRTVRELVAGRPARFSAGELSMRTNGLSAPLVYLSVEGPKGLRAAGRVADGVILGNGFDLRVLEWARALIAEGAREAGRDTGDIGLLAAGMICVDDDGEHARALVRRRLANRAHHNFRHTLETVPQEHRAAVQRFMDNFDVRKPIEERVPPELIPDYLVHRFAIAGTPAECTARISELQAAGISRFLLTPPGNHYEETLRRWAGGMLPRP